MRSLFFALGVLLVGGTLLWWWRGSGGEFADFAPDADAGQPVLILVVDGPSELARLRSVIAPERVVATTENGLALRGGIVVAAGAESAGAPLVAAGWGERPLQLFSTPGEPRYRATRAAPAPPGAGPPGFAAIARKPTLNSREALTVLKHLETTTR